MKKIAVMIGSLRKESLNRKLFEAFKAHAPEGVEFVEAPIDLPLFNADVEAEGVPAPVQAMKDMIEGADALIIITPEYNRSIPGVLKNAIDWASRPNDGGVLRGKKVTTAGATPSRLGTAPAQQPLRGMLVYFGMEVMGRPELYLAGADKALGDNGTITDEKTKEVIQKYLSAFSEFIGA